MTDESVEYTSDTDTTDTPNAWRHGFSFGSEGRANPPYGPAAGQESILDKPAHAEVADVAGAAEEEDEHSRIDAWVRHAAAARHDGGDSRKW